MYPLFNFSIKSAILSNDKLLITSFAVSYPTSYFGLFINSLIILSLLCGQNWFIGSPLLNVLSGSLLLGLYPLFNFSIKSAILSKLFVWFLISSFNSTKSRVIDFKPNNPITSSVLSFSFISLIVLLNSILKSHISISQPILIILFSYFISSFNRLWFCKYLVYLSCNSMIVFAINISSLSLLFPLGILFFEWIQSFTISIFSKSSCSNEWFLSNLTFKELFTKSITIGISFSSISCFSSNDFIHLPNCCKNNIREFWSIGLIQTIPEISFTWTPSFNLFITNINFVLPVVGLLNLSSIFLFALAP